MLTVGAGDVATSGLLSGSPGLGPFISFPLVDGAALAGSAALADGSPPLFDVDAWNLQYTHKDSSSVPWESFSDCPYADVHAESYDAHVHMDRADPYDMGVGLFNGVEVAPTFYNESTELWLLELRFYGLSAPTEAGGLRFVAELTDVRGAVIGSAPVEVTGR